MSEWGRANGSSRLKRIGKRLLLGLRSFGERVAYAFVILFIFLFVLVGPNLAARRVLGWVNLNAPLPLQVVMLIIFLVPLLLWAWAITHEQTARKAFDFGKGLEWARSFTRGYVAPLVVSVGFVIFSLPWFAALSCTLQAIGVVEISPPFPQEGCFDRLHDFYAWHVLDSIPGLNITETIRWSQPYDYRDQVSGWILLAFKIVIVLPAIGSFVLWRRLREKAAEELKANRELVGYVFA